MTVVKCAAGMTMGPKAEVLLYQASALGLFLFALVID